eukprot:3118529-Heterocapsa_arctica.AAC.1
MDKTPELNQHLVNDITVYYRNDSKGLRLGNQNHRSDKLTRRPNKSMPCLINMEDTNRESRHRRQIESCRIGEAANPGPGLDNEQHKQLKL